MKNNSITEEWFDNWANQYDQTLGKTEFHRQLLEKVIEVLKVQDNQQVLDIGCGTGLMSLKILQKADCKITCIDCSGEMLDIFKAKIKKLGLSQSINCIQMDASVLNFRKDSFDKITATVSVHHIKNKRRFLKSAYKILKPGGCIVIGEVDMDTTGKHTDIHRLKRILRVLEEEWIYAMKHAGKEGFIKMYDNAKKHIFNDGEYCISLNQWAEICREVGFKRVIVRKLRDYKTFGIIKAVK